MSGQDTAVRLTDDDVAFILTLLRNAVTPLSTAQIVEALKQRPVRQS
ncbi:MAG TPA: hypothetical protein VD767_10930 [Thermomicrobiales bacterium]|nr:hypothetical protein [Thermomicrobiales bacterium]